MIQKIIDFLIRKKVETMTGTITQTSKTKIFVCLEGVLRAVEFISPYFGHPVSVPENIHKILYTLAGLSYAERSVAPSPTAPAK